MISDEDKLEIREIVVRELLQVVGDIQRYGGDTGGMNDGSAEARVVAKPLYAVIVQRLQDIQAEKTQRRR